MKESAPVTPAVKLDVRFMGEFNCRIGSENLDSCINISSKSEHLLVYLLYFHPEGVQKNNVKELLYGDTDCDPENSLKALLFRLRKSLAADTGLPEKNVIKLRGGVLSISPFIEVNSDVAVFKKYCRVAEEEEDETARFELLQKAFEKYSGELLPTLRAENWVMYENSMLQSMYTAVVEELCAGYTESRQYKEVYRCYKKALAYCPFKEEWMVGIIEALMSLGEYRKAISEYEEFSNMLFDDLGIYPSEQLIEAVRQISDRMSEDINNVESISRDLIETDRRGAYYCNYPSFVDSYRLLRRIMERESIQVTLVLISLVDKKGSIIEDSIEAVASMSVLRMAVSVTLRKSDMYTRFSRSQVLLMLWNTPEANVPRVIERLRASIDYLDEGGHCRMKYEVMSDQMPVRPDNYELMRKFNPWNR